MSNQPSRSSTSQSMYFFTQGSFSSGEANLARLREAFDLASITSFSTVPSESMIVAALNKQQERGGDSTNINLVSATTNISAVFFSTNENAVVVAGEKMTVEDANSLLREIAAVVLQCFARKVNAISKVKFERNGKQADEIKVFVEVDGQCVEYASTKIQNLQRMKMAQKKVENIRKEKKEEKKTEFLKELQEEEAVMIQTQWRKHHAVKKVESLKEEREEQFKRENELFMQQEMVVKIQTQYRRHEAALYVERLREGGELPGTHLSLSSTNKKESDEAAEEHLNPSRVKTTAAFNTALDLVLSMAKEDGHPFLQFLQLLEEKGEEKKQEKNEADHRQQSAASTDTPSKAVTEPLPQPPVTPKPPIVPKRSEITSPLTVLPGSDLGKVDPNQKWVPELPNVSFSAPYWVQDKRQTDSRPGTVIYQFRKRHPGAGLDTVFDFTMKLAIQYEKQIHGDDAAGSSSGVISALLENPLHRRKHQQLKLELNRALMGDKDASSGASPRRHFFVGLRLLHAAALQKKHDDPSLFPHLKEGAWKTNIPGALQQTLRHHHTNKKGWENATDNNNTLFPSALHYHVGDLKEELGLLGEDELLLRHEGELLLVQQKSLLQPVAIPYRSPREKPDTSSFTAIRPAKLTHLDARGIDAVIQQSKIELAALSKRSQYRDKQCSDLRLVHTSKGSGVQAVPLSTNAPLSSKVMMLSAPGVALSHHLHKVNSTVNASVLKQNNNCNTNSSENNLQEGGPAAARFQTQDEGGDSSFLPTLIPHRNPLGWSAAYQQEKQKELTRLKEEEEEREKERRRKEKEENAVSSLRRKKSGKMSPKHRPSKVGAVSTTDVAANNEWGALTRNASTAGQKPSSKLRDENHSYTRFPSLKRNSVFMNQGPMFSHPTEEDAEVLKLKAQYLNNIVAHYSERMRASETTTKLGTAKRF